MGGKGKQGEKRTLYFYLVAMMKTQSQKATQTRKDWYYNVYLKSDEWKDLRAKAIEEQGSNCRVCRSPYRIQVHHLTYQNPQAEDLVVLCKHCHRECHHDGNGVRLENDVVALTRRFMEYKNRYRYI